VRVKPRVCKVCAEEGVNTRRPAHRPGPRCETHWRERQRHLKDKLHKSYVAKTYGLPDGFYEALYEAQGGRCAWCNLAMGKAKRLAVDHDHACCPGSTSCGKCARGLLCGPCNQFISFRMKDDPEAIRRGARYLERPPAREVYLAWNGP
jgi:hypothetical protein